VIRASGYFYDFSNGVLAHRIQQGKDSIPDNLYAHLTLKKIMFNKP
jgi:hypothetical protein